MADLKDACYSSFDERDIHDAIENELKYTSLEDIVEDWDIWNCIEKDYPINAKKIEQVYFTHIVPAIKERLVADNG